MHKPEIVIEISGDGNLIGVYTRRKQPVMVVDWRDIGRGRSVQQRTSTRGIYNTLKEADNYIKHRAKDNKGKDSWYV